MNNQAVEVTPSVITSKELLEHWQGHRRNTRRVIEVFPEAELFSFSIGGMRTFAEILSELLAIAVPALKEMVEGKQETLNEHIDHGNSKQNILNMWDKASLDINHYWSMLPEERFHDMIKTFGQYEGTVWSSIFYFIDNEIHHRAQGYVYLRSLGITPPYFYER